MASHLDQDLVNSPAFKALRLERLDVDSEQVTVDGVEYRKALDCEQTYYGQLGPLRVRRHLYCPRGGGRTICPLELRAGIVEGAWTPRAARLMVLMVAELPPSDAARHTKQRAIRSGAAWWSLLARLSWRNVSSSPGCGGQSEGGRRS